MSRNAGATAVANASSGLSWALDAVGRIAAVPVGADIESGFVSRGRAVLAAGGVG
ncbi:hypothetical protein [Streptomyces sp. SLBN-8D4]|uniref:hypothetical protein n=1 Tax=Streptomyces sp. SLBN-8D4 TaxID=3377728 RepID=UPI003C79B9F5